MSLARSNPRHRASGSAGVRITVGIGSLLTCTGLIAAGTFAGLSTSGSSYAIWNDSASISDTTISTGSLAITVNNTDVYQLDSTVWSQLLPGDVASQEVLVKNTGTINAVISASATEASGALEVRAQKGTCDAVILGQSATVSPTALGTWLPTEESALCIQVTLSGTADPLLEGQSLGFTLNLNATQES